MKKTERAIANCAATVIDRPTPISLHWQDRAFDKILPNLNAYLLTRILSKLLTKMCPSAPEHRLIQQPSFMHITPDVTDPLLHVLCQTLHSYHVTETSASVWRVRWRRNDTPT